MIELRWKGGVLEQRTRMPRVDANGAFCDFTDWSEWHPVPTEPHELRAIADHQDWIYGKQPDAESIEPIVGANIPEPFRSDDL